MKNTCVIILSLISFCTSAQFQDKWHIKFPAGSEPLQVAWADVDNDSLPDLVVANKINGRISFISYSDSAFLSTHELVETGFVSGTFSLCDFNRDNRIDMIMSGVDALGNHSTEVYLCSGSFTYQKQSASLAAFSSPKVVFADLNSDGQDEWVMAGGDGHLSAWRWNGNSAAQLFDSANIVPRDILVYDFDGNGFNDIAVSGTDAAAQPKMLIIEFANAFDTIRTIRFNAPISGKMDAGDVNNDGSMDLLVSGLDTNGNVVTQAFLNQGSLFIEGQAWSDIAAASFRIADIDADGNADMSVQGHKTSSAVNFIRTFSGDSVLLPTLHVVSQVFGDYDRDGDLDLAQLQDTLGLVVIENQTINLNPKPSAPEIVADLFIYNRLFLCWTRDSANHTPASTYDLMLKETATNVETYAAEFDIDSWGRLTVTHGNRSTQNFSLLRIPVTDYTVGVQKVDNAFVGSKPLIVATGTGGDVPGSGEPCQLEFVTFCSGDSVTLVPKIPMPTVWFSFSKGFMGEHASLKVESKTDTLFSLTPGVGDMCDMIRIYLINGSGQDTIEVTHTTTVCEGTPVDLTTTAEWEDVLWTNVAKDSVGSGQTLHYVVHQEDVLTASAHNMHGCVLKQTENLRVSEPALATNGHAFRIMRGETVALSASGADVYVWSPNESLDNGFMPNPIASPTVTTTYTLTGYDTLGCSSTVQVAVIVEQTAFVPSLFTPNGDGKNDELLVYGLSTARNFRFAIHNRDGNLVYEANDVSAVTLHGWNGLSRGVAQPPGLYYWKVEGDFDDGSQLNLNGRTTGSILLMR